MAFSAESVGMDRKLSSCGVTHGSREGEGEQRVSLKEDAQKVDGGRAGLRPHIHAHWETVTSSLCAV